MNMIALTIEGLPRGGTLGVIITSEPPPHFFRVSAEGTGAGLSDELLTAFDADIAVQELNPRSVHSYFTALLARRQGANLGIKAETDRFEMTASIVVAASEEAGEDEPTLEDEPAMDTSTA